ncbi:receptor-interacting serine/threonine-protein kinase 4 [Vigna unguiculata]|uniref:Receptor-interacting serine/threonine-protein kinase 4 n=1 Tax=Vigna unguiculata TaxID=3917 RepID=A0A4D6LGK9_VIGUN|nr:receptor-interacting serine/threonine-protein kinase 4 [Vigna unguiculata]
MTRDHVQIPIDSDDASWKERCSRRMKELQKRQFQSDDAASQLLHKDLVGKKKVMVSELFNAVAENGNVDNFVDVLQRVCEGRKVPLNGVFDQVTCAGDSLLHVAADKGRERIVELICCHFPELLIKRNVRGDTALHVAVRSKNSTTVRFILSHYAIEKAKHDGMRDNKEITREKNKYENTPLHEAVYSGDVGVVKEILTADKDVVHFLNKSRRSPLYLAAVNGNVEILYLLLEVPFPTHQPLPLCLGNSPLHAAILERNSALIEVILKKKPELVYLRDEDEGTPLHYAAYIGYAEGFRILLENSFLKSDQTVLEGNKKGHLPIHLACKRGHLKVVKKFLQHKCVTNLYVLLNQKGQNILHVAAKNGKSKVVEYLLENSKIDESIINQKDNNGNTPLHLASLNLFPKVLYLFTQDKRTDVKLLNNNDLTAQDIIGVALKSKTTIRKFLARRVLKEAGVPSKVNDMLHFRQQQILKMDLSLKDLLNTFLVVATLMVTVTFAAAFTVPGGVYSSDDPNPKKRGMAVLGDKALFWVFTTFNMTAMYSSVIACGLMLMALIFDRKLATRATILAMGCLVFAFLTVPVAFLAAVRLVVANNSALAYLITAIGVMYTSIILSALFAFFPIGIRLLLFRQVGRIVLQILIALIDYDEKPRDSSSPKENNRDNDD